MKPGMAALRLGFLARELWFKQLSVWEENPITDIEEVRPCLSKIEDCLDSLSSLVNDFQRDSLVERLERIGDRHSGAAGDLGEMLNEELKKDHDVKEAQARWAKRTKSDETLAPWKAWQREDWKSLHALLTSVVRADARLAAWFEVGDHFAEVLRRLRPVVHVAPLSDDDKAYLCSGIDRLSDYEQRRVRPLLQLDSSHPRLLQEDIWQTFIGLCALLTAQEEDLTATPKWNGSVIEWHGKTMKIKKQHNNVITVILGLFEESRWAGEITLSSEMKGDITQALYNFNSRCDFLYLSLDRKEKKTKVGQRIKVRWSEPIKPRPQKKPRPKKKKPKT